jgi:sulfate transport system ATP-binding protein
VNLFHGRFGHAPGGNTDPADVSYVRPHELEIVADASDGTLAVTLSQALTVGPQTRIEFKRDDDGSYVDVELPRSEYQGLREKLQLATGSKVHLKPRRVQRFASDELPDPAAMI